MTQRGRPRGRPKKRVGTTLPSDLYAEVQEYSRNHLININAIIELALRNFLHPPKKQAETKKTTETKETTPYRLFKDRIKMNLKNRPILRIPEEHLFELLAFCKVEPRPDTLQRYLSKLAADELLDIKKEFGIYTIIPWDKKKELEAEREAEKRKQEDEEIKKILNARP